MPGYKTKVKDKFKEKIIEMFCDGYNYREIQEEINVSQYWIRRMVISVFGYDQAASIRKLNRKYKPQKEYER